MADKWIPSKAKVSEGNAPFNEGAGRQVNKTTEEVDMLDKPLPEGSMRGSSDQPINSGTTDVHYNGGTKNIPASAELGGNR
jgi:hypothetical protein